MSHRWVPFNNLGEAVLDSRVTASELISECGENILEHPSIQVVPGTKETSAKNIVIASQF